MMNRRNTIACVFAALFVVAIPAIVHALFTGLYVLDPDGNRRTFWIGPVSTTIPFVILAVLFLCHALSLKSKSRTSPYCGAVMAWLGMMAFTVFLICQTAGPELSSTMGIAVMFTPFFYFPYLLVPYVIGSVLGLIWIKRPNKGLSNQ